MRKLAIIAGIALVIGACSKSTEPGIIDYGVVSCGADNGGTITLTFTAPNGTTPIAGAVVSVANCRVKTDGRGSVQMLDVPAGNYTLTIKKGIFEVSRNVSVESGQEVSLGTISIPPDAKKMLVILGDFDSIQEVLARLGFVYDSIPCYSFITWSQDSINAYDYIFFNCGAGCDEQDMGDTLRPKLRNFLNMGDRRIYASDWQYEVVEIIDSSAIDFYGTGGMTGEVMARVLDPDLIEALGRDSMLINFDMPHWAVMIDVGPQTDILIKGDAPIFDSTLTDVPFAVIFPYGQGKVLYTSFHNEAQNTEDMDVILEQMILK